MQTNQGGSGLPKPTKPVSLTRMVFPLNVQISSIFTLVMLETIWMIGGLLFSDIYMIQASKLTKVFGRVHSNLFLHNDELC
jgi:hypothetical protein